ncbi:MAG: glycosyltransferase family 2 protein, partial [bacterium]
GIMVITTINPVWEPILNVMSKLRIRRPEFKQRNFITNEDIRNLLNVTGYQVLFSGYRCAMSLGIPILAPLLNYTIPHLPALRYLCSTQFIVATPCRSRREYSISVVIPCFNEAENIRSCIERVPAMGTRTEIVVVDDGSTDNTAERAKEAHNEQCDVRVIEYSPNRGKLHAVTTGFQAATGDILVILDADMTVRPEDLPRFYEPLAGGYADFVNGTRAVYPMEQKAMKFANYFGNKLFSLLVSWIIDQRVSDTLCGTKAFFRKDYSFFEMGHDPWGDFDLLFGIARQRRHIVEVPIHYKERKAGVSKMKSFTHGKNLLKACMHGFRSVKLRGH